MSIEEQVKDRHFKMQMEKVFIPTIKRMIEQENKHLVFLLHHNTIQADEFAAQSTEVLIHLKKRLKEYENYITPKTN